MINQHDVVTRKVRGRLGRFGDTIGINRMWSNMTGELLLNYSCPPLGNKMVKESTGGLGVIASGLCVCDVNINTGCDSNITARRLLGSHCRSLLLVTFLVSSDRVVASADSYGTTVDLEVMQQVSQM